MNRLIKILTLVLGVVALTSCSTVIYTPYQIDVLRPADYTLPPSVGKILIINCIDVDNTSDFLTGFSSKEKLDYLHRIPSMMCTIMNSNVSKSEFMTSTIESKRMTTSDVVAKRDSLLRVHNADAIVALTKYYYETTLWKKKVQRSEMIQMTLMASAATQLSLILPSAVVDFEARQDTIEWTYCEETEDEVIRQLPKYNEVYYSVAEAVGETYASLVVPTWETVKRYIMASDKKKMRDAVEWIRRDNWENAVGLWREEQKTASAAEKARAEYDIAIYYEHSDNLDEAAIWCSKALDTYGNRPKKRTRKEYEVAQKFFEEILIRKQECQKLDRQLGAQ